MTSSRSTHLEKTIILTLGQMTGVGVGFLIPVVLSRWLSLEAYGTYKQLMLIHAFLLLTVHMGMDWGLFYFIKRDPKRAPCFSLNACLVDFTLAAAVVTAGLAASDPLARALNNPALALYLPAFAPFVLFSVPAHHFAHFLIVLDRIKSAAWLTILYELLKTAIIVGGYLLFNSLQVVLLGLSALAFVRLATLFALNFRLMKAQGLRRGDLNSSLLEQIRYGLPLGLNNLLTIVLKGDRFLVSSFFGLRQFTYYAVGCFELPVVEATIFNLTDLMSFDMVTALKRNDFSAIRALWLSTMRKVALLHIPLTVYGIVFADDIIRFLYSDRYADSVPFFRVFSLVFLLSNVVPEVVFRVFARTKTPLVIQSVAATYTVPIVVGATVFAGPLGTICGKLLADAITVAIRLGSLGRLMHLSLRELLPWKELARLATVCAFSAAAMRAACPAHDGHRFLWLALTFAGYGTLTLLLLSVAGVIHRSEWVALRQRLFRWRVKASSAV